MVLREEMQERWNEVGVGRPMQLVIAVWLDFRTESNRNDQRRLMLAAEAMLPFGRLLDKIYETNV